MTDAPLIPTHPASAFAPPLADGSVRLRNLSKTYADDRGRPICQAVQALNLEIRDGEFMVLVGPSGCGKSTVLRMIAGLEEISGGTIEIGGRAVNRVEPKDRGIAMVFQNYALYPHMTVFDNLAFSLKLAKKEKAFIREAVRRAATTLGLEAMLERNPRLCPADNASAWRSDAPLSEIRGCFSSTSRFRISTPRCACLCARRLPGCTPASRPP
jgi:ABC-type glutathione transport system ATPase component